MNLGWSIQKFFSPLDGVAEIVNKWSPPRSGIERDAEESLYWALRRSLPGVTVKRQVTYDVVRADILVDYKVAVELKMGPLSAAEYKRLIGQIDGYSRWPSCKFLLVLVGGQDSPHIQHLRSAIDRYWDGDEEEARLLVKRA